MARQAIYHGKTNWVLGYCLTCGTLNYVEPHGTTAQCKTCRVWTEHANIPYEYRNMDGTLYYGPARFPVQHAKGD